MSLAGSRMPVEARLLAMLPLGVVCVDREHIRWANAAFAKILETTVDALIGTNVYDFIDPPQREMVRQRAASRRRGEPQPDNYELTILSTKGRRSRVVIEPRLLSDTETVVLVRDVTDVVRSSDLLVALGELAAKVQRARTTSGVLGEAVDGLGALGLHAAVFQLDGAVARLVAFSRDSLACAWIEAITERALQDLVVPLAKTLSAHRILEEGRAVFLEDALPTMRDFVQRLTGAPAPEGFDDALREAGMSKILLAPLALRDQVWGFLAIAAARLLSSDAAGLSLFASQLSAALDVAQSIEALELRNRQLEAIHAVASIGAEVPLPELVSRLLQTIIDVTGADAAILHVLDRQENALVVEGAVGYDGPLLKQYARVPLAHSTVAQLQIANELVPRALGVGDLPPGAGEAVRAEGFAELAIVPLVLNGQRAGSVNLARRRPVRFTGEELRTAQLLMTQVALQFERARLYSDARRRVEDLSLINELGALITQHLDLEKVLETAMRHMSRLVDVKNTFLLVSDESERVLKCIASNLDTPATLDLRLSFDESAASVEAVRTLKPVVIPDTETDPRTPRSFARMFGHRALMAVPLLSAGKAIGAVVLGDTKGPRRFTPSEVERAVAVANQLATAVDHARLFSEQRQRVEQLRLLLEMSQVITGSLDLPQILEASAQSLVRMIDATDAFIWLLEGRQLKGVVTSDRTFRERFSQVRLTLEDPSAVALAIVTRNPVRIEDALSSAQVNRDLNASFGLRGLLVIPLMLRGVPIGAISIGDRRRHRSFSDDEVERALLISRQVAVAIDNARLFEDLKRSYHELSRAQQELVKRERLAALGELSAVVAHEVRNPLGVIFNSLASLKRMNPQTSEGRMLLEIVGEEADRLNRMVSDLLDFARPHQAQLRPENIGEVVQGALEAAARAMPSPEVTVRFEQPTQLPPVPMDAQMIRQAMVNLVVNAVQAMPRGGTVTVRAIQEKRGGANYVRLEVEDNGPGIPPELADRVFQPFFTTKAAGSGLGLAVVKRIADAHRAEISVNSLPGQGSTFTLWLQASD